MISIQAITPSECVFGVLLTAVTIAMAVVDGRKMILPNSMNLVLALVGIAQVAVTGRPSVTASIGGALAGLAIIGSVAVAFRKVRGIDGIGGGDQKFVAAAGVWVGWQGLPYILFIASTLALAYVSLRLVTTGGIHRDSRIPLGPFLGIGLVTTWVLSVVGLSGG